jgi:hypothetical protein
MPAGDAMGLIRIGVGVLLALASAAWADSASTQPASPDVVALVRDLTSDQFSVRESAQKELEGMGDAVVPELQGLVGGDLSGEARARIGVIIGRIHEERQFGGSIITIHCHDAPLENVLRDFAQQAGGADLGLDRPQIQDYLKSHKISLDLDHVDFWTALQAIEDGSGLHIRQDTNGQMILDNIGFWFGQMGDRAHSCIAGPCMICPQSIDWHTQFTSRGVTSFLNVQLMAMVEPKIRLSGGQQGEWIKQCVDENGHSLVAEGVSGFMGGRQWWVPLSVNLRVFPGMGTKIARMTGELTFNVQMKSERIEVDNLLAAHNETRAAGGGTLIVQDCKNVNGQYQLRLEVTGPPDSSFGELARNYMGSSMQVQDVLGQPLQLISGGRTNDVNGMWSIFLGYPANPPAHPPQRLVWDITTQSRRITVPFELKDLNLLPTEVINGQSPKSK